MESGRGGLPRRMGLIGVGTLGSAVIRGLLSDDSAKETQFVVSPRGAAKAKSLADDFPTRVRVAAGNQEVLDGVDCVVLAVLPQQAEEVLGGLAFRPDQQVFSCIAGLKLARLKELVGPPEIALGLPLPTVATRQGSTILTPARPFAQEIFGRLGTCIALEDQAQFERMQCLTCVMGDFYKRQLTAQEWLAEHGVPQEQASAWVGAVFAAFAAGSAHAGADSLSQLVEEQTPGGLNEMVLRDQAEDGAYQSLRSALDCVFSRLHTGRADPSLAPAAKRRHTATS